MTRIVLSVVMLVALASGGGCGKSPTSPATIPIAVTPPATEVVASLEISGPRTMPTSEREQIVRQFMATVTLVDGRKLDVTSLAKWRTSSFPVIFPTSRPGEMQAQGGGGGEATISATVSGVTAEYAVRVIEPGTFKLSGRVRAASTGGPLMNAYVKVTSNPFRQGFSDVSGYYEVYGVAGPIELSVKLDGFALATSHAVVTGDTTLDLVLSPLQQGAPVAGAWTATFSASSGCRDKLPAIARDLQYDAVLTQESPQAVITLTRPSIMLFGFPDIHGEFRTTGTMLEDSLTFTIAGDSESFDGTYVYPDFFDRLAPDVLLGMSLTATAVIHESEIRGTFVGDIVTWTPPYSTSGAPLGKPAGVCRASDHVIVFRRR